MSVPTAIRLENAKVMSFNHAEIVFSLDQRSNKGSFFLNFSLFNGANLYVELFLSRL